MRAEKKVILNFRFGKRYSDLRKSWNCHVKVKLNAFALCMISKFSFRLNILYILCKLCTFSWDTHSILILMLISGRFTFNIERVPNITISKYQFRFNYTRVLELIHRL